MRSLVVLVAIQSVAFAGGHHGGHHHGGGGHGSSGGWHPSSGHFSGGHWSSSGGSSEADGQPPCDPSVDVAALGGCRRFGDWAIGRMPHIMIELGSAFRRMPSAVASGGADMDVGSVFRLSGELRHHIYLGAEGELGGQAAFAPADPTVMPGMWSQRHGVMYGAAAIVGVRVSTGRAVLSPELAVGGRGVIYPFNVRDSGVTHEHDLELGRLVIEPRVRGEVWLSPYVSGGLTVGANTVARGDWMAGVFLGLHTRAFGSI